MHGRTTTWPLGPYAERRWISNYPGRRATPLWDGDFDIAVGASLCNHAGRRAAISELVPVTVFVNNRFRDRREVRRPAAMVPHSTSALTKV
jgi:hypothetical protein